MPAPTACAAAARWPAAVPLTAIASSSAPSAPSTSVQAAALITRSGRSASSLPSARARSVTSSSVWPKPTTSWPALPAARTRSRPSIPLAPVTSTFMSRGRALDELQLRVVADHQPQRLRHPLAAGQLHVATEEARLQAGPQVFDQRPRQDDRVLDLGAADLDPIPDRRVRAHVGVLDLGAGADHRGAANGGADDLRAGLDHHPALDPRRRVDLSLEPRLDLLQDEAVGREHVGELAGVLPPAGDHLRPNLAPAVDQS